MVGHKPGASARRKKRLVNSDGRLPFYLRSFFLIPVFVILALFVLSFLFYSKDCGDDLSCFDARAASCLPAHVSVFTGDSLYDYAVKGKHGDDCIVSVRLVELHENERAELKELLEGKEMVCSLPRATLNEINLLDVQGLTSFCTGPLKEVSLEISVQKIYELVVQNLGPIASEYRDQLGVD